MAAVNLGIYPFDFSGKLSKGLCAATPNGAKWRRLAVSTVKLWTARDGGDCELGESSLEDFGKRRPLLVM